MSLIKTIEDNELIFKLNQKIAELKALVSQTQEVGSQSILLNKFDEAKIDIIYDNGASIGKIILDELEVNIIINGKTTRVDRNGNIVQ